MAKGDSENSIHVSTRVTPAVLRQIDQLAQRLSRPGMAIKRSAAVRHLITLGLRASEESGAAIEKRTPGKTG